MKPVLRTVAGNGENQDRALVIENGSRVVLCVANGAGGLAGDAEAATIAVELVRQNASSISNAGKVPVNDNGICVTRRVD